MSKYSTLQAALVLAAVGIAGVRTGRLLAEESGGVDMIGERRRGALQYWVVWGLALFVASLSRHRIPREFHLLICVVGLLPESEWLGVSKFFAMFLERPELEAMFAPIRRVCIETGSAGVQLTSAALRPLCVGAFHASKAVLDTIGADGSWEVVARRHLLQARDALRVERRQAEISELQAFQRALRTVRNPKPPIQNVPNTPSPPPSPLTEVARNTQHLSKTARTAFGGAVAHELAHSPKKSSTLRPLGSPLPVHRRARDAAAFASPVLHHQNSQHNHTEKIRHSMGTFSRN